MTVEQTEHRRARPERSPIVWGVGMLAVTVLALVLDVPMLRGLVAFALVLVTLRGVLAVWTLGFVRPGARVDAAQGRMNLYVLGALGLVCCVTLLG